MPIPYQGRAWTPVETEALLAGWTAGIPLAAIADSLHRSPASIAARLCRVRAVDTRAHARILAAADGAEREAWAPRRSPAAPSLSAPRPTSPARPPPPDARFDLCICPACSDVGYKRPIETTDGDFSESWCAECGHVGDYRVGRLPSVFAMREGCVEGFECLPALLRVLAEQAAASGLPRMARGTLTP